MANKFPTAKTFTAEPISKGRMAIYENGEYICQLTLKEASSWIFRARRDTVKHAADEAHITVTRIKNALEYLASRKLRESAVFAASQINLF